MLSMYEERFEYIEELYYLYKALKDIADNDGCVITVVTCTSKYEIPNSDVKDKILDVIDDERYILSRKLEKLLGTH